MKFDIPISVKVTLAHILKFVIACLVLVNTIHAQDNQEKKRVRLSLQYLKTNNNEGTLLAGVKTKIDRSYEPMELVEVHFYANINDSSTVALGSAISNSKGIAKLELSQEVSLSNLPYLYRFAATIKDSPELVGASKELEVYKSHMELHEKVEDSLNIVEVQFSAIDSLGNQEPLEDINVKLYVKRMFGNLPVGDDFESTDSEGTIRFVLPNDVPVNDNGLLTVIAKLDDDATYGTVVIEKEITIGAHKTIVPENHKRELWTDRANTPIALLIVINGMIIAVWGTILYIVFQLVKIKKIGKHQYH